jgi:hypothetical protein
MIKPKFNKKAFKYAIWSSMSRVISVALGAGAGVFMHQMVGDNGLSWGLAFFMAVFSYGLMFYAEYKKDLDE